ncbi:Uncharacterised protein [Mycobacterium tuberculosis]|nr:Uncharacterised protein [Mycobacterium tuberculosis]
MTWAMRSSGWKANRLATCCPRAVREASGKS